MGKKSRRQRGGLPVSNASRRGLIPIDVETGRRNLNSSPSASTLSPERRAAAIAAAEAECRAAFAALPQNRDGSVELSKDRRSVLALIALREAVTLDEVDRENCIAYLDQNLHAHSLGTPQRLIKAIKRWPRIRKYWPRLRRRLCWGCGKQYDLSEPRLWVCGACGEARYCDEACQREHWPAHKRECLHAWTEKVEQRLSQGVSREELQQELDDWYQNG